MNRSQPPTTPGLRIVAQSAGLQLSDQEYSDILSAVQHTIENAQARREKLSPGEEPATHFRVCPTPPSG